MSKNKEKSSNQNVEDKYIPFSMQQMHEETILNFLNVKCKHFENKIDNNKNKSMNVKKTLGALTDLSQVFVLLSA